MCQCDRLCLLQMCEARHIRMYIIFHDRLKCFQKLLKLCIDFLNLITDIEFHIKGNLVITASSCVKLFARISDTFNQICLYEAVDILIFGCDLQPAGLYICKNTVQTAKDLISLFFCQNSLLCKHSDMCLTSTDILFIKFLVK